MRSATRQRGAAAVFVAISMVASIAALAMTLDLGRLYFTHRDLQLLADMAALDAARSAGGCLGQTQDPQGSAAGEAASSMQRNGASLSYLTAGAVEIGREVSIGGVRTFVPDDGPRADSVKVTLRRPLPPRLIPIFAGGSRSGVMTVAAAASLRPIVSLDVGSGLAEVSPEAVNDIFPRLFGPNVGAIGVASYNGLFNASVSLGDLSVAANAGSVENFLDTEVTAPDLLGTIADALGANGDTAVRTTLTTLAAGSDTSNQVLPRSVLGVPAGGTADDAVVNVGALVTSLAEAANGDNLINLPIAVNLPPLGQAAVTIRLIEVARPAVGPPTADSLGNPQTFANTAQGLVQVSVRLLPILGQPVTLKVFTQLADASAGVTGLLCAQRGRPQAVVTVEARTGIGGFGVGDFVDLSARTPPSVPLPAKIVTVDVLGIPVQILARANVPLGSGDERSLRFDGPFPAPAQFVGTDPGEALATAVDGASEDIKIYTVPDFALLDPLVQQALGPVLQGLKGQIAAALRQLSTDALAPLMRVLGASVGTGRVQVRSVVAQQPVLYAR